MRGSVAKALRRPPSSVVTWAPRMAGEGLMVDWAMGEVFQVMSEL
jgi:hypothetical protein